MSKEIVKKNYIANVSVSSCSLKTATITLVGLHSDR